MKTVEQIQHMLDESVNELLAQHGGKAQVVSIDREASPESTLHVVHAYVKMSGGCRGCAGAKYTLNMLVTNHITAFDPTIDAVVDISDHTDKSSAYYKE